MASVSVKKVYFLSLGLFQNQKSMSFCIKFRMSERKFKCSKCGMLFKSTQVRITTTTQIFNCERFEPRSHFKSRLSLIVRVNVVLNGTIVLDSDLVSGEQIAEAETKSLSTTTVLFRTTFSIRSPGR